MMIGRFRLLFESKSSKWFRDLRQEGKSGASGTGARLTDWRKSLSDFEDLDSKNSLNPIIITSRI